MSTEDYLRNANPLWLNELIKTKEEQGRTLFLLYFNIRDVVFDRDFPPDSPQELKSIKDYLAKMLTSRDIVLSYSLHSGIEIHKGSERLGEQEFKERELKRLWDKVAGYASNNPFQLSSGGRSSEDPAPPHRWRVPHLAIPLLTRCFTHNYFLLTPSANKLEKNKQNQARRPLSIGLIIDYLHHLAPVPGVITQHSVAEMVETLQRWSTDSHLQTHNHFVVMLAPDLAVVHPELQGTDSRIATIRISRPVRDERASFLQWLAQYEQYSVLKPEIIDELANRTSGMNYIELRDLAGSIQRAQEQDWPKLLAARRAEIIHRESGGLLVPKESQYGLDSVAGYHYVREHIERLIPRLREGRADVTGILFAGPPGTGKSFYASALARDAGVNVVVMRNVRNMYVGQSERNLEQVLEVARSLAPVVIFIDEIDQAFSNRQGQNLDGGVEQRLLGRLLEFMDDKDNLGQVIWIAASNRPDLIDDALLSRFKLRLPFLLPDKDTCFELLKEKLPSQVGFRWQESTWTSDIEYAIESGAVGGTYDAKPVIGKYSGRELETIVRTALWKAEDAQAKLEEARQAGGYQQRGQSTPIIKHNGQTGKPAQEIAVDANYLLEGIRDASVGHDENEYLRQSLLALRSAPFSTEALAEAVRTALPRRIADDILEGKQINKERVDYQLSQIRNSNSWR